ncbi:N-substituted formamide deformylase precursor [compost metagenome]
MITRQNPWNDDPACFGDPISLEQALTVITSNGAIAMGLEHSTGSLQVGKAADLIVIDRDLFAEPARNYIHKTQVLLTLVEGQLVYDRHSTLADIGLKAVWQGEPPVLEGKAE